MNKFKKLEREIIDIEANINKEKNKIEKFNELDFKRTELNKKEKELDNIITHINELIEENYKNSLIKENISKFAKIMFNEEALLSVGLNTKGNIDFNLKLSNNNNFDNEREEGNTLRKLLSFLFSIAILIAHRQNFFKFVVLDSPFDGDKTEYQEGLFKVIEKIANEFDIQVILTSIEDEIKIDSIKKEAKRLQIRYLKENDKLIGNF